MALQEVTIVVIYFGLAVVGDLVILLAGLLILAGVVDGLMTAVNIIRKAN